MVLMPFCAENTEWSKCPRYGIDYDKPVDNYCPSSGCDGTICACEPFGEGDFTYGIADDDEFKWVDNVKIKKK